MGAHVSAPSEEEATRLRNGLQDACAAAARSITEAEVFIFLNGAGWSADSGLAVYADVAKVPVYSKRGLTYQDICQPHWLFKEPQLFWGFWGQCYNDYRLTDPHEGYEMVHHWVGKLFRHTKVAKELQQRCREKARDQDEVGPYEVKGRAGAFHVFTSNVDAHHYDWFPACEIRECHGNTEIYQCAGSRSMGGLRDMDERCPGIWRAPLEYRFHVDKETMLAPKEAPEEAFEVETNHWAPPQGDEDPMSTVPRVGRVTGSARRHTLRFMRSGAVVAESPASAAKRGFAANHPVCPECGGPARPAILMFGDYSWRDNDAQEDRWETWLDQVNDLATERTADFNPLRVALLEVGAGNNVTTVRSRSEHILRDLVEKGAEAKLLRVNPDFPLVGNRDLEPHTISLMGRGLESLRLINAFMGTNSFGLTECPPPPPAQAGQPRFVGRMVVEVLACHPTQPGELRIRTPEFAKFCHLKAALARHLDCDPRAIHLVRKGGGEYSAYRDDEFVDETRQLTVVGVHFDKAATSLVTVSEEDMVEDSFGRVKPRPSRNVHAGDDDEPPPLVPGSGFGTFGGLGGIRGFSTLGSLGSRGLIAHKAQAAASSDEELDEDPTITYEEVTGLQRELRDRFAEPKFQDRLQEIERKADGPGELARKRQELMLEVQSVVLPKYGFEGSRAGVYKMMAAMGPYVEQPEFNELAEEINCLLGLRSPPETWRGLSKACARASKEQVPNGLDGGHDGGYPNGKANGMSGKDTFDNVKGIAQPGVWPSDKKPPFTLSIAGSWNGFVPDEMEWEDGLFVFPMEVGDDGWDCFQLLQNGSWDKVVYPSIEEAGADDKYTICGPDTGGHDRSWQIGKVESEEATPGSHFVVCVSLDDKGKVSRVSWEKL